MTRVGIVIRRGFAYKEFVEEHGSFVVRTAAPSNHQRNLR
jgi:hypothetical protein